MIKEWPAFNKKLESTLKGILRSSEPRNGLIIQIRDRDKQMGEAALCVLNLLESDWGHSGVTTPRTNDPV